MQRVVTLLLFGVFLFSKPIQGKSGREIHLPNHQQEVLAKDLPGSALHLDGDHALWILGRHSLWQWTLQTGQLKKIPLLSKSKNDQLHSIVVSKSHIFVASHHQAFEIAFDPLEVKVYSSPYAHSGKTLDLAITNEKLFWLRQNGIMQISLHEQSIEGFLPFKKSLDDGIIGLYQVKDNSLWLRTQNSLMQTVKAQPNFSLEKLHSTRRAIQGATITKLGLFLYTQRTILRYNSQGKLIQSIPVEGEHHLVAAHFGPSIHSLLFSDGSLQRLNLKKKKSQIFHFGELNSPKKSRAKMYVSGSIVALLTAKIPQVFQLEGGD